VSTQQYLPIGRHGIPLEIELGQPSTKATEGRLAKARALCASLRVAGHNVVTADQFADYRCNHCGQRRGDVVLRSVAVVRIQCQSCRREQDVDVVRPGDTGGAGENPQRW